jgi:GNAT superfamily N-acetyltransferase
MNSRPLKVYSNEVHISVVWRGEFVGYMGSIEADLLPFEDKLAWWIARSLVKPESLRSHGIGSEMMSIFKQEVLKSSTRYCIVSPGGYSNKIERQMNFYKKNGFTTTKEPGLLELQL